MKIRRFEWKGATTTALAARRWTQAESFEEIDAEIAKIETQVRNGGDAAVLTLTARFDATEKAPEALRLDSSATVAALEALDSAQRESLEVAAANIRAVAEAQIDSESRVVELPQGQVVTMREVPVGAAGVYAPGGLAAYPSSVLMCAIPAMVAGVKRVALASPPRADGTMTPIVLAAAAICGVEEIYAMGGAQAVFALALGTETIEEVDVIAGPGNSWVQEAKRKMFGFVGLDSYAGPSELMAVVGPETDPEWVALDLCAQAEHGESSPLLVASTSGPVLDAVASATEAAAAERVHVGDSPLAMAEVPSLQAAVELANAFVPEHLELLVDNASELSEQVTTAGCVFAGRFGATAFGDYAAGSNHVLPTMGAGRFAGPLGPGVFRRKISTVEVSAEAAAKLAPHVDVLARAEGFPVHGESAMIRSDR